MSVVTDGMVACESHWFDDIYQAPGICHVWSSSLNTGGRGDQARPGPNPVARKGNPYLVGGADRMGKVPLWVDQEKEVWQDESTRLVPKRLSLTSCNEAQGARVLTSGEKLDLYFNSCFQMSPASSEFWNVMLCTESTPMSHHSSFLKSSLTKV